jgi:hypothetical protein
MRHANKLTLTLFTPTLTLPNGNSIPLAKYDF